MRLSSHEIRQLTSQWRQAVTASHGLTIGPESQQFRLHKNDISFHELEYDDLRTAAVELTKVLLFPGPSAIIDLDHYLLWSWCAEVLFGRVRQPPKVDSELYTLAHTTTRAALTGVNRSMLAAVARAQHARSLIGHDSFEFISGSYVALTHLSFPLLETVTRRACGAYIDLDGTVCQSFPRSGSGMYSVGQRCSSVANVLRLLRNQVADAGLQTDLDELLGHVAVAAGSADGYQAVYAWRNATLHGEQGHITIGGTIYTLALLIELTAIKDQYSKLRDHAWLHAQRFMNWSQEYDQFMRPAWSFYPMF